jgi:hypothetical protein
VLEKVRQAGNAGVFVARAYLKEKVHVGIGYGMVFEHQELHAVFKRKGFYIFSLGLGTKGCAEKEQ